jgi:hypothetical protein
MNETHGHGVQIHGSNQCETLQLHNNIKNI